VGCEGSSSIFLRSQKMCTSSVFVGPEPVGIPDLVHDPFPAQDLPGARHQEVQQIELAGGELDRAVVLGDGARGGVETERPDLDTALLISAAAAPHDRSDPRRELARRGFDDVVVRAELESEYSIDLLTPSREHHDRNVGLLADLPCEISAVSIGKHHIEQHEVGCLPSKCFTRAGECGRHLSLEPSRPRLSASGSEMGGSSSTRMIRVRMRSMVLAGSRLLAAGTTLRRRRQGSRIVVLDRGIDAAEEWLPREGVTCLLCLP
jgi:hypothetical protein